MKLLIIGSGGREHALAWRLLQSARVEHVYVAPGNGGTALLKGASNVALTDPAALADFVQSNGISLTVVGPEAPLALGVVDIFRKQGLDIFGPTRAAAQLESSKDFAKSFMVRHHIPTALYQTFTEPDAAHAYIDAQGAPIVIKADGLAAGKGVVVATTRQEAHEAVDAMLGDGSLGSAGARVVIEECLLGEEASFIVMCDGKNIFPLATSQDHKRLKNGDQGPNTGGMGAYSPAPVVTSVIFERALKEIIEPTIHGMHAEGHSFTGFLYAGLMIGPGSGANCSIKVLEFNCRMGDPETQPIMMRIKSDLLSVFEHGVKGTLDQAKIDWDPRTALGVVMASHNYPASPRLGDAITGIPEENNACVVFHAGTTLVDNVPHTSGGRVLCVTALDDTVRATQQRAYEAIQHIQFEGAQFRTDIGWRALET